MGRPQAAASVVLSPPGFVRNRSAPVSYTHLFLKTLEKTGAAAEASLVLEDSDAGARAAVAAGIPVACVPDVARPSDETLRMATGVFDSLLRVMEWLKTR